MVVESYCLNQIWIIFTTILEVFLYYLLETIDIESLIERRLQSPCFCELFKGFFLVLHLLKMEESITQSQSSWVRKFLQTCLEHSIYFLEKLNTHGIHAIRFLQLFLLEYFQRAINFTAQLFVSLNVPNEQSSTEFLLLLIAYQLKYHWDVLLQLLPCLELEIVRMKSFSFYCLVEVNNDGKERKTTNPNY